ncbi:synaptonemal complex protein 2-like isoform X2 [Engraulis encrasicolus]|uniref:synaptonemal complex protein 2-like isoform X2 n=1 Tax=Engraulis encrasicolus TaxID=184585 RepID=UPI002FD20758
MDFEDNITEAFAKSHVQTIVDAFGKEKCLKSFADRVDNIVNKELDKAQFKNVLLVVKAIERVMQQDQECFHTLVQQGVVIMMVAWYERTLEHFRAEQSADSLALLEAFFDTAVNLSHSVAEGKTSTRTLLILRFGALVMDETVSYKIRLDAIQTINSMLNGISKEDKRDIYLSPSLSQILEKFVDAMLKGGDYEFQVALTESLYRMTIKRTREEVTRKWFSSPSLASSFMAIKFVDFETDCRIFLNEVNKSFGDNRGVFTFPCSRAYLDTTELFKPNDDNLKEFWIDFNVGSSCITFSVHDPENTLWGSVCLLKTVLDFYELSLLNDQNVLTVSTNRPVLPYGKLSGYVVQLFFSACHDIAPALHKVFGETPSQSQPSCAANSTIADTPPRPESSSVLITPNGIPSPEPPKPLPRSKKTIVSPPAVAQKAKNECVSWDEAVGSSTAPKELDSSNMSVPSRNYTRKKPKVKVLPLSSPSSGEEKTAKASRKHVPPPTPQLSPVNHMTPTKDTTMLELTDSGFLEPPEFEGIMSSSPHQNFTEKNVSLGQESFQLGKRPHEGPESSGTNRRKQPVGSLQLGNLFPTQPLEGATDAVMAEGQEPDADLLGADVMATFQSFKTQLLDHVAAKYQRIETTSLQSLSDCQNQVTTLLRNVHAQRLQLLERFEQVVEEQLVRLEQDCRSLRNIEQETMTFWRTEYQAVRSFCERQQNRLGSLTICNGITTQLGPQGTDQMEQETLNYNNV